MVMQKTLTEVPYRDSYFYGDQEYPARYETTKTQSDRLVRAPEFTGVLTFNNCQHNNNSITAWMKDDIGELYPMFQSDFLDMVQHGHALGQGRFVGAWRMVRRGGRYGLINDAIQAIISNFNQGN
jgi:hypothetical protein